MTIINLTIAILVWFGVSAYDKHERDELRKRLESYGPGEVIG